MFKVPRWMGKTAFATLLALSLLSFPAAADFVFMTDGYTLQGTLRKEGKLFDDAGHSLWAPKVGWVMDDGVRRVYFHQRHIAEVKETPPNAGEQMETFKLTQPRNPFHGPLQNVWMETVGPWTPSGMRKLRVRSRRDSFIDMEQFLTQISPQQLRASARIHRWDMPLLPSEVKPQDLFAVLKSHADGLRDQPPEVVAERLARFSLQAGWLDEAELLRDEYLQLVPDPPEPAIRLFRELDRQLAFRADQQIQLAMKTGQHQRAQQLLERVRDEAADDSVLTRLRAARADYKRRGGDLETVRRLLAEVRKNAKSSAMQVGTRAVLDEIEAALGWGTSERLASFLQLAQQEERRRAQGKEPVYTAEQLAALAVSGWIMGPQGAEPREAYAIQLCQARDFAMRYLNAAEPEERTRLLYQYQRGDSLGVDEMAQMLRGLPPAMPDAATEPAERERVTPPSAHWPEGVRYLLRRPPEYTPHLAYPVLILLPNIGVLGADPQKLLETWGPWADRYGYLLALPRWAAERQSEYGYSVREHAVVTEVIRDLRRRDNVDGERIALAGIDQSGIMTFDVALAQPGQFAAAVVICGLPGKFSKSLENNGQYLPFYLVDGEKNFNRPDQIRRLFDYWLSRGFPSLYCEYFARGFEEYQHEIPFIFDWLHRKRLAKGLPELGKEDLSGVGTLGQPMRTLRSTDQRLYWLTTTSHGGTPNLPAELVAKQLAGNSFQIKTQRFRQLSIWLNQDMVDFEQPVEIRINPGGSFPTFKKAVQPSLEILMEDFYERGDRSTIYSARVDFDLQRR